MAAHKKPGGRFANLSRLEWFAITASGLAASILLLDPLVLGLVREFDAEVKNVFRGLTHLGRSSWILFPAGAAVIMLLALRTREIGARASAAYFYVAQICGFVFGCVAGSGIIASLAKNIIGRARPKLFESVGPLEFEPFAFHADFASFPSGHATTAFALAGAFAMLFPKARVYVYVAAAWIAATRFLIAAHFFSDVVAGGIWGFAFSKFLIHRMAARRWLFQSSADGAPLLRGRFMLRWIALQLVRVSVQRSGFSSSR